LGVNVPISIPTERVWLNPEKGYLAWSDLTAGTFHINMTYVMPSPEVAPPVIGTKGGNRIVIRLAGVNGREVVLMEYNPVTDTSTQVAFHLKDHRFPQLDMWSWPADVFSRDGDYYYHDGNYHQFINFNFDGTSRMLPKLAKDTFSLSLDDKFDSSFIFDSSGNMYVFQKEFGVGNTFSTGHAFLAIYYKAANQWVALIPGASNTATVTNWLDAGVTIKTVDAPWRLASFAFMEDVRGTIISEGLVLPVINVNTATNTWDEGVALVRVKV
jgi:hypothetical protein